MANRKKSTKKVVQKDEAIQEEEEVDSLKRELEEEMKDKEKIEAMTIALVMTCCFITHVSYSTLKINLLDQPKMHDLFLIKKGHPTSALSQVLLLNP